MAKATEIAKNIVALPLGIAVGVAAVGTALVGIPLLFAWGLGRAVIELPSAIKKAKEGDKVIDAEKVKK